MKQKVKVLRRKLKKLGSESIFRKEVEILGTELKFLSFIEKYEEKDLKMPMANR